MKLCVIVPTIGRESLVSTLESLRPQMEDSLGIIACDVRGERADWVVSVSDGFTVMMVGSETPWGHRASNAVLDRLPSSVTHTWRIDDDDVAAPTALGALRAAACSSPVFARFRYPNGALVWAEPELREGNVGTPCILAPRSKSRWGLRYEGDFDYATSLATEFGGTVLWLDEKVATVYP